MYELQYAVEGILQRKKERAAAASQTDATREDVGVDGGPEETQANRDGWLLMSTQNRRTVQHKAPMLDVSSVGTQIGKQHFI